MAVPLDEISPPLTKSRPLETPTIQMTRLLCIKVAKCIAPPNFFENLFSPPSGDFLDEALQGTFKKPGDEARFYGKDTLKCWKTRQAGHTYCIFHVDSPFSADSLRALPAASCLAFSRASILFLVSTSCLALSASLLLTSLSRSFSSHSRSAADSLGGGGGGEIDEKDKVKGCLFHEWALIFHFSKFNFTNSAVHNILSVP